MTNNITKYDAIDLLKEFEEFLKAKYKEKDVLYVPAHIFSRKLSPFETVVKYLVENRELGYSEIGSLLKKDRQVIWTTYKRAKTKLSKKFKAKQGLKIPTTKLSSEKLSIFELIVLFLKREKKLNIRKIAEILKRDTRTIWTVYYRAKKKTGDQQ